VNLTECGSSSTTAWEKLDGTVKNKEISLQWRVYECFSLSFGEANA